MKKLVSLLVIALLCSVNLLAQEDSNTTNESKFGVKAGYSSFDGRSSFAGNSISRESSGFYIGTFAEFYISDSFSLQPELTYVRYSEDSPNSDVLLVPVLFKYKPTKKLGLLAGPQLDYFIDEPNGEFIKRLGLGLALGLSYDIIGNVSIDARYTFGISNRLKDNPFIDDDLKIVFNYFQVGLAYRF